MKVTWQGTLAVAVATGLCAMASLAQTQERTTPRVVAKQADDVIAVNNCFLNMIDKITVAAGRGGVLAFVRPEEGHEVKMGEQVAKVKDEVAAAQFATADKQAKNDIEIRFAEKSAEVAMVEYQKALNANQVLPGTNTIIEMKRLKLAWERAELQKENAEKEHDIAKSKRDEAGELLQTHVVESPIGGVVTKVYKHTGEAVREGDAIIDVVNTDRMRVSGYVPFKDVSRIRIGDKVVVKLEIRDADVPEEQERFEGRITFIDRTVTKVTNPQIKIFAEVINREGILRDGSEAAMVLYPGKAFSPPNATTRREFPRENDK